MIQRFMRAIRARHMAVLALAGLLAACQSDPGAGGGPANNDPKVAALEKSKASQPACFSTRDIDGWNSIDPDTVRITVGVNHKYDLKLFTPQPDLTTRLHLAIVTPPGGSDWICSPMDLEIIGEPLHIRVPIREIIAVPPPIKGGGAKDGAGKEGAAPSGA
ncbi:MAG: DUF6491 family protein [Azospirillaceae bacterium]|nr:DUF6491 family protein [Azospirillaceae bacterium]